MDIRRGGRHCYPQANGGSLHTYGATLLWRACAANQSSVISQS
jgi:hypothetical protein